MEIEQRLSGVLSEFARTMVTDFPIQAILDHLVLRIVDVLPINAAGVTLISPGANPRYVAASDASALRFEQLQTELGEGPCLAAYESGAPVAVLDVRHETRFPTFIARASDEGLVAVFTFPLRHGEQQLGALDVYRATTGPMDEAAMSAAQTLADVAAAYLLNAQARSDLKDSTERARQTSLHDALTGLPNRALLVQRLDHAILRCRRSGKTVAILFVDLDRFKAVNDAYGHHVGDELLIAVAGRLSSLLRPGDTLARMAGDEFVVLCEDLDHADHAEAVAARIGAALDEALTLSSVSVRVTASVGIAFAGRGDEVPERVLRDADTAMYQVKRTGGGRHAVIDLRAQSSDAQRVDLSRDLAEALRRDQLHTEYQPIVATTTGQVTGVEALLRWSHPTFGPVGPETAVPLAEQAGMIGEIGRWVLERACLDRNAYAIRHRQHDQLAVAVNVSANQLMAPDFAAIAERVLSGTRTAAEQVTLEVTESVFIQDSSRALVVLQDLKDLGVMLALDDFGTGYSSLSYLKQFPFDIVKIDRSFVADLGHDPTSRHIVGAIVGLGHDLGMTIVAEGVESPTHYEEIMALGCDAFQGYYFAPPQSAEDLDAFLVEDTG